MATRKNFRKIRKVRKTKTNKNRSRRNRTRRQGQSGGIGGEINYKCICRSSSNQATKSNEEAKCRDVVNNGKTNVTGNKLWDAYAKVKNGEVITPAEETQIANAVAKSIQGDMKPEFKKTQKSVLYKIKKNKGETLTLDEASDLETFNSPTIYV